MHLLGCPHPRAEQSAEVAKFSMRDFHPSTQLSSLHEPLHRHITRKIHLACGKAAATALVVNHSSHWMGSGDPDKIRARLADGSWCGFVCMVVSSLVILPAPVWGWASVGWKKNQWGRGIFCMKTPSLIWHSVHTR